jgi:hypothetical protein
MGVPKPHEKQLQATLTHRPSLLHANAAQRHTFGLQFGAKQRQSLFTSSRLSVTLAVRFMCFRREYAVTHPLKQAACILSRRHELHGWLGVVAAAGAGFVRAICREGAVTMSAALSAGKLMSPSWGHSTVWRRCV